MAKQPKGVRYGGRQKGTPNKLTANLREAILAAAEAAGGEGGTSAYLARQANENPAAFMTLLGKVLPTQISGDPQSPLVTHIVLEAATVEDSDQASA